MTELKKQIVLNYYNIVKAANKELTKKEAFKDLLNRLYSGNIEIERIIDKISSGAETTILNIPRKDKIHRGSADTLYNNVIIEFENDLKKSLNHAMEQLAGYLLGQINSGMDYNFVLIATDCISWKVFAPDISQLDCLENLNENELKLNEIDSASITLDPDNYEDFYFWIDRFLFRETKQKATLKKVEESFGYQSSVFIESFRELSKHYNEAKRYGEVQVSLEQWEKFLSIAYGSFDASENNFLIHTYLSVFAKILAYAFISNDEFIDENDLKGILDGSVFNKYNIENFVDNDFFHWISDDRNFGRLKKVFRIISQEISIYEFNNIDEDILKGVYQELIDIDTRHALGEYYTPDWLCERIAGEFNFTDTDKVLDPSCGSGSFLRSFVHRIRQQNPEITVEELCNNIHGIDIHPLSVQISKTTLLIALGKDISKIKKPIHLNVLLANSLLTPEGLLSLFGSEFAMFVDTQKIWLNTKILDDVKLFDIALDVCDDLAGQSINQKLESKIVFKKNLINSYEKNGISEDVIDNFYKIYESLKYVKEKGRDSIWKFIIQNLYKPYFLNKKFDFVIGNPPWFTYSSVKNGEYQNQLNNLAEKYNIKPEKVANIPHLEIAAIFLGHSSNYFLKEGGKLSFVLPRSFFNADHHDNTRSGKAFGFKINQIWDLKDVKPLFRIPSCVFFVEKTKNKVKTENCIDGITFEGNLQVHNCNLISAKLRIKEGINKWYYIKQGKSTAFSTKMNIEQKKINPYKNKFKQGATIVPRAFYFIQLEQEAPPDWEDRLINVKTSAEIETDAKKPWKGHSLSGRIDSRFIFYSALSKSILPFALFKPDFVVLPIEINNNDNLKEIQLLNADDILHNGYRSSAKWFRNAENIWNQLKSDKSEKMSNIDRLNFQKGLSSQNLNLPYLVLYNASAKDANAAVLIRKSLDLEFLVESISYIYYTDDINEAYYLTSILNSKTPNLLIKDFQPKGLFGPRHVHKRILDIYFPKYDEKNKKHRKIAKLGKTAHEKSAAFLDTNIAATSEAGNKLGNLRLNIRKHLSKEMEEIDILVKSIMKV